MQCSNFDINYFSGSLSHPMLEVRVTLSHLCLENRRYIFSVGTLRFLSSYTGDYFNVFLPLSF